MTTGRPKQPHSRYPLSKAEKERAVSIFNEGDPEALINMVGPEVKEAIKSINPVFLTWSEKALAKHAELDPRDHRIRISMWDDYNQAKEEGRDTININRILNGVCTKGYFYQSVLKDPKKLAWIFYPPADYTKYMQECLYLAMGNIRDILSQPIRSGDGKLNHRLIDQQIKIWEKVESRVKGAIPQALNINQRSMNVNINQTQKLSNPKDIKEIEAEIARLEGKEVPKEIEVKSNENLEILENLETDPSKEN